MYFDLLFLDCPSLSINQIELGRCSFVGIQTVYMESKKCMNDSKELLLDGNGIGEYIKSKEEEIIQYRNASKESIEFAMSGFDIML